MKNKIIILILIITSISIFQTKPDNQMKTIKVEKNKYLTAATESGFTDENFYSCVIENYNKENSTTLTSNDTLTDEQLATITEVVCEKKQVSNINGIEKLTSIRNLNLNENNITSVDLTNNKNLQMLNLTYNNLNNIDVSKNTELQGLYLNSNKLSNIDVSNNIKLLDLNLNNNNITSINLSNNTLLQYILLSTNELEMLDLSKNTKLQHIYASGNNINKVVLPATDSITRLDLHSNKIDTVDISKYTNLEYLVLSSNKLTNLDLSKNINLTELYLSSNYLTELNLTGLTKIKKLNLTFNEFKEVNIPNQEIIELLTIDNYLLKNLDISKFLNLKELMTCDHTIIPVYGTSFDVNDFFKYKPSNIIYNNYKLYSSFTTLTDENLVKVETLTGEPGQYYRYVLYSDQNVKINNIENIEKIKYYDYIELRYMILTSKKYQIDEEKNTIDVGEDTNEEILKNLNISWENAKLKIDNDTLTIQYNDTVLREFSLQRISNPQTGSNYIYTVISILTISIITIIFILNKKINCN